MKVGFFLLKFPVASETFVLNQITAFIDMGYEVEIVAIQKGDLTNTHSAFKEYNLAEKTTWLMDEPQGKVAKLQSRGRRLFTTRACRGIRWISLSAQAARR